MNIVPLAEADIFIRDTLFEVRRGIARSRNANQSNPLNGAMVDLPEKIDFEMMIISSYQDSSLARNSTATTLLGKTDSASGATIESDRRSNSELDRDLETQTSTTSASGVGLETDAKTKRSSTSEASNGTSLSSELESSGAGISERSSGIETESSTDLGSSQGSGLSATTTQDWSSETTNSVETSNTNENESGTSNDKQNMRQSGQILESNKRIGRAFDKKTGKWGLQSFPPVTPQACTLKCS